MANRRKPQQRGNFCEKKSSKTGHANDGRNSTNLFCSLNNFNAGLIAVAVAIGGMLLNTFMAGYTPNDAPSIYVLSPSSSDGSFLTQDIRNSFDKDGVIAVRGLLSEDLLERLDRASEVLIEEQKHKNRQRGRKRVGTQFYTVRVGAAFLDPPIAKSNEPTEHNHQRKEQQIMGPLSAFRDVALDSPVPFIAAELMGLANKDNETMRLQRDIFLAKDDEEFICGWHVDDYGFWPSNPSSVGINAWVALDDMPVEGGGGFALAVGSHSSDWRMEAHRVTGTPLTFPPEGFQSAADMFANRSGKGTCNLETAAPHLHERMEQSMRVYEIKRGDVIFHTRWLFHRTVPFDRSFVHEQRKSKQDMKIYRRYSIRYGPGTAEVPLGYGTELSVMWNEENAGRTGDQVAALDGPWYPKCWPSSSQEEMNQLQNLVETKIPVAEKKRSQRQKEMRPFLQQMGRQQQQRRSAKKKQ